MKNSVRLAMILLGICCLAASGTNAQQTYEYSTIVYDHSMGAVYGNSVTEIDYNSDYYYDAYVESYLYENGSLVDSNYAESATGTASAMTAAWADPNAEYTETGYHDLYVRFGNEEKYPEGCMPCDGCNTDCYWDNWYYYDAYGFSFASTGSYGPWFELFGEGPAAFLENNQEEYLGETSASISPPCPIPTNFRQSYGEDDGNGNLEFEYDWDSSTGNLADLSGCTIGEKVTYPTNSSVYVWPSPPFNTSTSNPFTSNAFDPTSGYTFDHHLHTNGFVTPYHQASFTATQYYRYKCPCASHGQWINLMGPLSITRRVSQNSNGTWKYTVTKSGRTATVDPLP